MGEVVYMVGHCDNDTRDWPSLPKSRFCLSASSTGTHSFLLDSSFHLLQYPRVLRNFYVATGLLLYRMSIHIFVLPKLNVAVSDLIIRGARSCQ